MLGVRRSAVWRCRIKTSKLLEEMKMETVDHYISLRKLRWAGHIARMAQDRAPRKFLTSWIRRPRPHGRPQFTFGHSLNKTLKRAGISTDFKEWTELAQDRAGWQKLIYQTAKSPPRNTARRLVTHDLTQSPGTYRGLAADGHSCPLHLGARIGRV